MVEISPSVILEEDRRPKPPLERSGWALLTDSEGKPPFLFGGKEVYLPTEISFRGLTEYMKNEIKRFRYNLIRSDYANKKFVYSTLCDIRIKEEIECHH